MTGAEAKRIMETEEVKKKQHIVKRTIILEKETKERFGYYSDEIRPGSIKRVVVECQLCEAQRTVEIRTVRKIGHTICYKCSRTLPRDRTKVTQREKLTGRTIGQYDSVSGKLLMSMPDKPLELCTVCNKVKTAFKICGSCEKKVAQMKERMKLRRIL